MRTNPRSSDHAVGSPIRLAQDEFKRSYCELLRLLEQALNGAPQVLGSAIGANVQTKGSEADANADRRRTGNGSSDLRIGCSDKRAITPEQDFDMRHKTRGSSVLVDTTGSCERPRRNADHNQEKIKQATSVFWLA
jgi:hypothetical protein